MSMEQNGGNPGENQFDKNQFKSEDEMTPDEIKAQEEKENLILNFKEEDLQDDEKRAQLEEALKNSKTTIAQKRHYREKFRELAQNGGKGQSAAPAGKSDQPSAAQNSGESFETSAIIELRQDNPWMGKDVAKEIVEMAKSRGESVSATMARPYVAAWLQQVKNDIEVEEASLPPSRKGGGGSGAEERDWSTATPEEIEKQRLKILSRG